MAWNKTGTLTADPQFVSYEDEGAGDYRLAAASPCRNGGVATEAPATDYDGVVRPREGLFDIGAFEAADEVSARIVPVETGTVEKRHGR